jgi:hypothetical protein
MKTHDRRHNNPGRPRKPAVKKRTERIAVKLTPGEYAALRANAIEDGITGLIVRRCCQPPR